ncbi:uncharacterized protein LOC119645246 [Glossina fuscipes]|uniref:Uncharacterized protein LOC119645246 n=1 Tax=Glossina fuscipes TaxID=7396 RepID=A0A9C5ZK92_9MUSC|nr:uncharacterized protein LOC119645246 [Glossina fuscipes]
MIGKSVHVTSLSTNTKLSNIGSRLSLALKSYGCSSIYHTYYALRKYFNGNKRSYIFGQKEQRESSYSLDLGPCDVFLFPKLQRPVNGRSFVTIKQLKTASPEDLRAIP